MIFSPKIAKLGKAPNIKIYQKDGNQFEAIITGDMASLKDLTISGTNYNLGPVKKRFIYKQMEHLSGNLYLANIDNNYSIIEVNDGF